MIVFYTINFNDEERKQRMIDRFHNLGLVLHFVNPVYENDPRINDTPLYKRVSSIMLQHLDSVRHFYENTSARYCVVCEDDVYISKHFVDYLPDIINNFDKLDLDVLLLGYLIPYKVENDVHFPTIENSESKPYSFHRYPDDLWGSQMYMISRKHAKYLLDTFTIQFAIENLEVIHYNPDWTITKYGNRALIYPLLAVEEGEEKSGHDEQSLFHRICFECNYDPMIYI